MTYRIVKEGGAYGVLFASAGRLYRMAYRLTIGQAIGFVRDSQVIDKQGPKGINFESIGRC
jgi:hypothetical protein